MAAAARVRGACRDGPPGGSVVAVRVTALGA
jgi:hypothetical protein